MYARGGREYELGSPHIAWTGLKFEIILLPLLPQGLKVQVCATIHSFWLILNHAFFST